MYAMMKLKEFKSTDRAPMEGTFGPDTHRSDPEVTLSTDFTQQGRYFLTVRPLPRWENPVGAQGMFPGTALQSFSQARSCVMEGAAARRPSRSLGHLGVKTLLETETHIKALEW